MRVLICPLDWGLGHASRCIPIIKRLLAADISVVIASSGGAAHLLQTQFPDLPFHQLPSYGIRYPSSSALLNFSLFAPRVLYAAVVEHLRLRKIIRQEQIQFVISDNRLGCWSRLVPSFYISHQLQFAFRQKWLATLAAKAHHFWYKNYDELWIPDLPPPKQIAGKLARPFKKKPVRYLGLLSQLAPKKVNQKYRAIIILSGPEPQRSRLEAEILAQLEQLPGYFIIVRGLPNSSTTLSSNKASISSINFLGAKELSLKIAASKVVVCRSGYSSLMDLLYLQKRAILIPTPGQPEQEYLAQHHAKNALFRVAEQDNFKLAQLFQALEKHQTTIPAPMCSKDFLGDVLLGVFSSAP